MKGRSRFILVLLKKTKLLVSSWSGSEFLTKFCAD